MSNASSINLKGSNFTLLVIHVYTTCLGEIRRILEEKIKKSPYFLFKNAPIVINVANLDSHYNWPKLYQTISDTGLCVVGVCCCHDKTLKEKIIRSGLPILTSGNTIKHKDFSLFKASTSSFKENMSISSTTQLINTPIRSGQKIYARNSDLIIISNVSAGAEIIADGNIHIYGIMRGRALAGASGREESQIFCTHLLSPELVSIGGRYWLNEHIPKEFLGKAVRVSLKKDTLIIQYL